MIDHSNQHKNVAMSIPASRGTSPHPLRQWSAALGLSLCAVSSHAACDTANPEPADAASLSELVPFNPATSTEPSVQATGQTQLAELVRAAVVHSAENRGAEHTRNAAQFDLEQTRAGRSPQAAVNASLGLGGANVGQTRYGTTGVNSVGLTLSAPLYDGGRLNALTSYREGLLSASGANVGSARERVVREAVLTVLDRNRYGLQLKVYQQYVAKLACLTQSVEQIVQADPGRASERVQARKSLRQTEIARDETQAAWRQAESRLQQLLGDRTELWTAWSSRRRPAQKCASYSSRPRPSATTPAPPLPSRPPSCAGRQGSTAHAKPRTPPPRAGTSAWR
jgi:Outer membrane efflux protein